MSNIKINDIDYFKKVDEKEKVIIDSIDNILKNTLNKKELFFKKKELLSQLREINKNIKELNIVDDDEINIKKSKTNKKSKKNNKNNITQKEIDEIVNGFNDISINDNIKIDYNKLTFVELFCGLGVFHMSINNIIKENQCLLSCDINDDVKEIYKLNFNIKPQHDVLQLNLDNFEKIDMIVGSPPCQSFSIAGKKLGIEDIRGELFFHTLNLIEKYKPKYCVLENVKNILKVSDGIVLKMIKKKCEEINYYLHYFLTNPTYINIPQNRDRVYFILIRKDLTNDDILNKLEQNYNVLLNKYKEKNNNLIILNDNLQEDLPEKIKQPIELFNELILQLPNEKSNIDLNYLWYHENIKKINKFTFNKMKYIYLKYKKIFDNFYIKNKTILDDLPKTKKILEWTTGINFCNIWNFNIQYRQSGIRVKNINTYPCLTKSGQRLIIGKEKRFITIKECSRLQSFPDDYKFLENDNKNYQMLGNSINIQITSMIIETLFLSLNNTKQKITIQEKINYNFNEKIEEIKINFKEYCCKDLITYIGNKRKLLPYIQTEIEKIREKLGKNKLISMDGFSGSGSVSKLLKYYSSELHTNDLENYCKTLNECYLSNPTNKEVITINETIDFLNNLNLDYKEGNIYKYYSPKDTFNIKEGERCFYTTENGLIIDNIRQTINNFPDWLKKYCISPLLVKSSIHNNTSGIFRAFHKNKQGIGQFGGEKKVSTKRMYDKITLDYPTFLINNCKIFIHQQNTNELIKNNDLPLFDIVYYDPPYNQHSYGANYFMLNLINDNPLLFENPDGVAGIYQEWNRSDYYYKNKVKQSFEDLLKNTKSLFIIISYNNEGILNNEEWINVLSKYKYEKIEIDYNTYGGSRNLKNRSKKVKEILWIIDKRDFYINQQSKKEILKIDNLNNSIEDLIKTLQKINKSF